MAGRLVREQSLEPRLAAQGVQVQVGEHMLPTVKAGLNRELQMLDREGTQNLAGFARLNAGAHGQHAGKLVVRAVVTPLFQLVRGILLGAINPVAGAVLQSHAIETVRKPDIGVNQHRGRNFAPGLTEHGLVVGDNRLIQAPLPPQGVRLQAVTVQGVAVGDQGLGVARHGREITRLKGGVDTVPLEGAFTTYRAKAATTGPLGNAQHDSRDHRHDGK